MNCTNSIEILHLSIARLPAWVVCTSASCPTEGDWSSASFPEFIETKEVLSGCHRLEDDASGGSHNFCGEVDYLAAQGRCVRFQWDNTGAHALLEAFIEKPKLSDLLGLYDFLGLPAEVILLLVNHCVQTFRVRYGEGRRPTLRQIEKEGSQRVDAAVWVPAFAGMTIEHSCNRNRSIKVI